MPIYEYESDTGPTVLLRRPVDQRDAPVLMGGRRFRRRTVPSRISVATNTKPPTMSQELTKGYYHLEQNGKLSDKNPNYLSVKNIKEALALPDVD